MSRELTDLLHLRTESLRQFRIAFRAGGPVDELRAEIHQLQLRIDEVTRREHP